MSHLLLRRTAGVLGLSAVVLAATGLGVSAVAHAAAEPARLDVAVTGPATGDAGGTGDFTVVLTNAGEAAAGEVRLRPDLPEGITVVAVGATDSWTCVLGPLRCTLPAGLAAGSSSEALPVELHYDGLVEGRQQIVFVAAQADGPVRMDAGRTTVVVTGAPDWTVPPQEPGPARPAPAEPAPAEPAPAEPAAAEPVPAQAPAPVAAAPAPAPAAAPAPVAAAPAPAAAPAAVAAAPAPAAAPASPPARVAPAPAPAQVEDAPVVQAPAPLPAAEQEAPAALPFADEPEADTDDAVAAGSDTAPVPMVSAAEGAAGIYTVLLGLVFAVLLVAFVYLVSRVVAQRRALV